MMETAAVPSVAGAVSGGGGACSKGSPAAGSNTFRVSMVESSSADPPELADEDSSNLNNNNNRQSWNGVCFEEGSSVSVDDDYSLTRAQSPNPDHFWNQISRSSGARGSRNNLQVPSECYGGSRIRSKGFLGFCETLFEEESDLIRSCGALSRVLGLRRSFSTSDISTPPVSSSSPDQANPSVADVPRASVSELVLWGAGTGSEMFSGSGRNDAFTAAVQARLDYTSRSCSTWVAVGDMASTSQLPSPQGQPTSATSNAQMSSNTISATELIRSVNKKVRQTYIKRRLLTTYKALERMAQSELMVNSLVYNQVSKSQVSREILKLLRKDFDPQGQQLGLVQAVKNISLTVKDVEREKGKPLTKYERNMMIFNWLHSLDSDSSSALNKI